MNKEFVFKKSFLSMAKRVIMIIVYLVLYYLVRKHLLSTIEKNTDIYKYINIAMYLILAFFILKDLIYMLRPVVLRGTFDKFTFRQKFFNKSLRWDDISSITKTTYTVTEGDYGDYEDKEIKEYFKECLVILTKDDKKYTVDIEDVNLNDEDIYPEINRLAAHVEIPHRYKKQNDKASSAENFSESSSENAAENSDANTTGNPGANTANIEKEVKPTIIEGPEEEIFYLPVDGKSLPIAAVLSIFATILFGSLIFQNIKKNGAILIIMILIPLFIISFLFLLNSIYSFTKNGRMLLKGTTKKLYYKDNFIFTKSIPWEDIQGLGQKSELSSKTTTLPGSKESTEEHLYLIVKPFNRKSIQINIGSLEYPKQEIYTVFKSANSYFPHIERYY